MRILEIAEMSFFIRITEYRMRDNKRNEDIREGP
jgi:hypothetical protein